MPQKNEEFVEKQGRDHRFLRWDRYKEIILRRNKVVRSLQQKKRFYARWEKWKYFHGLVCRQRIQKRKQMKMWSFLSRLREKRKFVEPVLIKAFSSISLVLQTREVLRRFAPAFVTIFHVYLSFKTNEWMSYSFK